MAAKKDPHVMSAAEINRELDASAKKRAKLIERFVKDGRGHESWSETMTKSDPLALQARALSERVSDLQREVHRRAGPGVHRLPRGFGPLRDY